MSIITNRNQQINTTTFDHLPPPLPRLAPVFVIINMNEKLKSKKYDGSWGMKDTRLWHDSKQSRKLMSVDDKFGQSQVDNGQAEAAGMCNAEDVLYPQRVSLCVSPVVCTTKCIYLAIDTVWWNCRFPKSFSWHERSTFEMSKTTVKLGGRWKKYVCTSANDTYHISQHYEILWCIKMAAVPGPSSLCTIEL